MGKRYIIGFTLWKLGWFESEEDARRALEDAMLEVPARGWTVEDETVEEYD